MVGKTDRIAAADQVRLTTLFEIGCIPCMLDGTDGEPATIHHVVQAGSRLPNQHQKTYGACAWHHQGIVPSYINGNVRLAIEMLGPSLEHQRKAFERRYADEQTLILIADGLVRMVLKAKAEGAYLPSGEIGDLCRAMHREYVHIPDEGRGLDGEYLGIA